LQWLETLAAVREQCDAHRSLQQLAAARQPTAELERLLQQLRQSKLAWARPPKRSSYVSSFFAGHFVVRAPHAEGMAQTYTAATRDAARRRRQLRDSGGETEHAPDPMLAREFRFRGRTALYKGRTSISLKNGS
jgi:hypothetical protein